MMTFLSIPSGLAETVTTAYDVPGGPSGNTGGVDLATTAAGPDDCVEITDEEIIIRPGKCVPNFVPIYCSPALVDQFQYGPDPGVFLTSRDAPGLVHGITCHYTGPAVTDGTTAKFIGVNTGWS